MFFCERPLATIVHMPNLCVCPLLVTLFRVTPQRWSSIKQYFSAPASLVGVERVFSAAGANMHGDLRKSARDDTSDTTLEHTLLCVLQHGLNILKSSGPRGPCSSTAFKSVTPSCCIVIVSLPHRRDVRVVCRVLFGCFGCSASKTAQSVSSLYRYRARASTAHLSPGSGAAAGGRSKN